MSTTDTLTLLNKNRLQRRFPVKPGLSSRTVDIWYDNVSIKPYQSTRFMAFLLLLKIYSRVFTSYSYIELECCGLEIRHIMHMRRQKSEAFVKSFNRDYSTIQKKNMSDILTRPAVCMCISGSEAQNQDPSADHMLSRLSLHRPIFK